jgi:DNA-binding response OmpR family regulator
MSRNQRILVAEDDPGVRDLIRARLTNAGYDVHTAHNGREAVLRIRSLRPDALVLDINMPELDGFGVLELLAADEALQRLPVLVLTARHTAEDVKRAVGLGAKDFLTKPFSDGQLLARVARLLRKPIPEPDGRNGSLPEPNPAISAAH